MYAITLIVLVGAGVRRPVDQLIRQANEAFQNYLRFLGEKKYAGASRALEQLEAALRDLAAGTGGAQP